MKTYQIWIILVCLLLAGCAKRIEEFNLKAKVTDYLTGAPLPEVEFCLTGLASDPVCKFNDINGKVNFVVPADEIFYNPWKNYVLSGKKENYFFPNYYLDQSAHFSEVTVLGCPATWIKIDTAGFDKISYFDFQMVGVNNGLQYFFHSPSQHNNPTESIIEQLVYYNFDYGAGYDYISPLDSVRLYVWIKKKDNERITYTDYASFHSLDTTVVKLKL